MVSGAGEPNPRPIAPRDDAAVPAAPSTSPAPSGRVWLGSACTCYAMSMGFHTAQAAADEMLGGPPTPFPLARLG